LEEAGVEMLQGASPQCFESTGFCIDLLLVLLESFRGCSAMFAAEATSLMSMLFIDASDVRIKCWR
jgi:hypothetical protein